MGSDQLPVMAVISDAFVTIICAVFVATAWAAGTGRLKRNQLVGIRTPASMRSDQAWVAAHRAALRLTPLYLLIGAVVAIALVSAVATAASPGPVILIGAIGYGVLVPVLIVTAIVAGRAAKSTDRQS